MGKRTTANQQENNYFTSHLIKYFLIGLVIMILYLVFSFKNEVSSTTTQEENINYKIPTQTDLLESSLKTEFHIDPHTTQQPPFDPELDYPDWQTQSRN